MIVTRKAGSSPADSFLEQELPKGKYVEIRMKNGLSRTGEVKACVPQFLLLEGDSTAIDVEEVYSLRI
jgi:hypothetical protein